MFKYFWKSFIWAIIIFIICGIPSDNIEKVSFINIPYFDKFVHFILYFILTLLIISGFTRFFKINIIKLKLSFISLIISIIYGIIIEILQKYLFIDRSFDLYDILANFSGAFLIFILANFSIIFKKIIFRL
ncbi:MAG: VanZ family protein [Bacteroidales bacterium]|nr:VanZ family protein [Bacteroidales bacterium]